MIDEPDRRIRDERDEVEQLLASWVSRAALSEHTRLEIAYTLHVGHEPGDAPPLASRAPVPGCGCPSCLTLAAGGDWCDADLAEEFADMLANLPPGERVEAARTLLAECGCFGIPVTFPKPQLLALAASRLPGALTDSWQEDGDMAQVRSRRRLPVEEARRLPIVRLARTLGLGEAVRKGDEWAVLCPFHDDHRPSLRLNPEKRAWYCFVCSEGGDAIELVMKVRGVGFAEAVSWMVGR